MSSQNYFDLLGDDENEEPTAVIARATLPPLEKWVTTKKLNPAAVSVPARLPAKLPPSPSEAAKEHKSSEGGRGGRRVSRGVRAQGDRDRDDGSRDGFGRERGVSNNDRSPIVGRDSNGGYQGNRGAGYSVGIDGTGGSVGAGGQFSGYGGDRAPRGDGEPWSAESSRGRGGRFGGRGRDRSFGIDADERPRRREFDRRSGSGFGSEIKREGSGRGNWGAEGDQGPQQQVEEVTKEEVGKVVLEEKYVEAEHAMEGSLPAEDCLDKKEEDDNELTLDEYEKILEEKRKALLASKAEERKVQADKAFESMQLVDKKNDEDVFIKLGSDKEKKKKEALEKEEKAKKTQSISEFLKPADGDKHYGVAGTRGRGRGRGRGGDGDRTAGFVGNVNVAGGTSNARRVMAPRIEDPGQFPTLGAK